MKVAKMEVGQMSAPSFFAAVGVAMWGRYDIDFPPLFRKCLGINVLTRDHLGLVRCLKKLLHKETACLLSNLLIWPQNLVLDPQQQQLQLKCSKAYKLLADLSSILAASA